MKHLLTLPTLLAIVVLAGCSPCTQRCDAEAVTFERCLQDWDLEWADLGAIDQIDFKDQCAANMRVYVNSMEKAAGEEEQQRCSQLASQLRGEDDCEGAWEALVNYGADP